MGIVCALQRAAWSFGRLVGGTDLDEVVTWVVTSCLGT
jgi:hypothetical protein